jgi:hypothetical protein
MGYSLEIVAPVNGRIRKADILVLDGSGQVTFTDRADLNASEERNKLVGRLAKKLKVKQKEAAERLEKAWNEQVGNQRQKAAEEGRSGATGPRAGSPSQADLFVELTAGVELFHTPGGHDSEGYATVVVNGHSETWPVNGKGFRRWLSKLFYDRFQKAPGSQALQDALAVIAGKAIHDGPEREVAVRVAEHGGAIYLDLADERWRAVRVTPDGWAVVADPPVKFVRKRGMLALPEPVPGGRLDDLRPLTNLPDDDAWRLFVAWLVAALRPGFPFPILAVNGEHGSAKSTLCKMARALIDPNVASLRRLPREDRDLMIAATNGWVVGFDNLSGISAALSDALCSLATGGGFATRELYTDDGEKLFDAKRPIMLNGIEDLAARADLLDRAVCLTLPEIADEKRRDERELLGCFEQTRPRILGALLDAVAAALKNLPTTRLSGKPRMADFAQWVAAVEPALGWEQGSFLKAYSHNRAAANALALESSILTAPILALMGGSDCWQGTIRELLATLEESHTDNKTRENKEWPANARKLSADLRRLAPNLRRAGVNVEFGKHTKAGTPVKMDRQPKTQSPPSPQSPPLSDNDLRGDGPADAPSPPSPLPSPPKPLPGNNDDGRDGRDGVSGCGSNHEVYTQDPFGRVEP